MAGGRSPRRHRCARLGQGQNQQEETVQGASYHDRAGSGTPGAAGSYRAARRGGWTALTRTVHATAGKNKKASPSASVEAEEPRKEERERGPEGGEQHHRQGCDDEQRDDRSEDRKSVV